MAVGVATQRINGVWRYFRFCQKSNFGRVRINSAHRTALASKSTIQRKMNQLLVTAVLAVVLCVVSAKTTPPKVLVYTRNPGEYGKPNTLICHCSGFHPPDIKITLTKNGEPIPESKCNQSDLMFNQDWHFKLTKTTPITPSKGVQYGCRVEHMNDPKTYMLEPDM